MFVTLLRIRLGHLFNTQEDYMVETRVDVEQIWIRESGSGFCLGEIGRFARGLYLCVTIK